MRGAGEELILFCVYIADKQVNNLVDETLAKFKRIDFLINNGKLGRSTFENVQVPATLPNPFLCLCCIVIAGGQFRSLAADIKLKGWEAVMRTNL